jgi:hypothetical protein
MNYEQSLLHDALNIKTVFLYLMHCQWNYESMRSTRPMRSRIKTRETLTSPARKIEMLLKERYNILAEMPTHANLLQRYQPVGIMHWKQILKLKQSFGMCYCVF